jgi:alanyl-tRNA synthetase
MISSKIRKDFLKYFQQHGHTIVPSSPVFPHDDPTLLFTNAGMNQFKDVFLGQSKRDYTRATTSQKCVRVGGKHNDLDNVGHTSRHLTFFEMLGNFSFGDYFKKEAIQFAWEVSTKVFGFDPDRIYPSVFDKDDEAFELWKAYVPEKRIVRFGEKENFWAMGDTGPCGPCSELLYDRGDAFGSAKHPYEDASGERFLEFWNLVFMQYNRSSDGKMTNLPKQSIDTGSGLERVVSLKMGVDSVFATDIFQQLISEISSLCKIEYSSTGPLAANFHVIADHIRMLSFAIADGVVPSNIDRGYVLRKVLRRAVRYGKGLGFNEPFLGKVLPSLITTMGDAYPELKVSQNKIETLLHQEEEAFFKTLRRGGNILSQITQKALENDKKEISGQEAFLLKDTYGLPLEEITLLAKDSGLFVDIDSFNILEQEAKMKSKKAATVHEQTFSQDIYESFVKDNGTCEFVGFDHLNQEAKITGILKDGALVSTLAQGEKGSIILNKTPFYAEKGGQVGDVGSIHSADAQAKVLDTKNPFPGLIIHDVEVVSGTLKNHHTITASVNSTTRQLTAAHHSATHILHKVLTDLLGEHIKQAGSLVTPHGLRFDFAHHEAIKPEVLRDVEKQVNAYIRQNIASSVYELDLQEAQKKSEIKQFFGDKYGSKVRVVDFGASKELCGGTHVSHLGMIGLFKITKESSIASGVRRIEAVCGELAEELAYQDRDLIEELAKEIKCPLNQLKEKVKSLKETLEEKQAQLKQLQDAKVKAVEDALENEIIHKNGIAILVKQVEIDENDFNPLFEKIRKKHAQHLIVLGIALENKCQLKVAASQNANQLGFKADEILKSSFDLIQGQGGGKAVMAQATGKHSEGLHQFIKQFKQQFHV